MNAIFVFVAIAYALSVALSLIAGVAGGDATTLLGLRYLIMFIPAAAVVTVRSMMNEDVRIDWNRLPLKYVPLALLLMPVVMHVTMVTVVAAYAGGLPPDNGLTPQQGFMSRIAINVAVGLVASALAFFEEVGWRGWLLPRLAERLGVRRAVVTTAAIWALWHVPFQLSGIQHIDGVSPVGLALSLPVGIFAAGLIIGWLWMKTQSIWIVTLAHGTLNWWGQYAYKYMQSAPVPGAVVAAGAGLVLLALGTLSVTRGLASFVHRGPGGSVVGTPTKRLQPAATDS